jgi:hypothetical protein
MRSLLVLLMLALLAALSGCSDDTKQAVDLSKAQDAARDQTSLLPNDATCTAPAQCRSSNCSTASKCAQGTLPADASCTYDEQCAGLKCTSSTCAAGGGKDLGGGKTDSSSSGDGACGKSGAACCPTTPKCESGLTCSNNKCVKAA